MRLNSFETTIVQEVPASVRDELLACQHPSTSIGDEVHMDSDYVFDASVDDGLTSATREWCKQVLEARPETLLFIFIS